MATEVKSKLTDVVQPGEAARVKLDVTAYQQGNEESLVMVSINPSDGTTRAPCDICCVVDISGSMGSEAKTKNDKGDVESHGLTLLDIVKHAVKTIVMCMDTNDRLALVTYHTSSEVVFNLRKMDKEGKEFAKTKIEALHSKDSTNLWGGLETGLDVLKSEARKNANSSLFLLTDGLPNVIPPRGHIPMFKKYIDKNGLPGSVGTFGFGYQLDSQLLHDIAVEGNGLYSFIPDSSFVGTAFVNAMSNALVTVSRNVELSIETMNGVKIVQEGNEGEIIGGGHLCSMTSWGAQINLGPLQFGQSKDIVFKVKVPKSFSEDQLLTATVNYQDNTGKAMKLFSEVKLTQEVTEAATVHSLRTSLVRKTNEASKIINASLNLEDGRKIIKELITEISTSPVVKTNKFVQDLQKDVSEQVTEAISRDDWYKKWGKHYLLSLTRAHLLQQSTNFKDYGLQHYGGNLFTKVRDTADDIFIKIPPPKPTIKPTTAVSAPLTSMNRYHYRGAPCFSGDSKVLLADLTIKEVRDVAKGDFIRTPDSCSSEVKCVVKTYCSNGKTLLVKLDDGLKITPWHPIRVDNQWKYPCELEEPVESECEAVYSFVLEANKEDIMIVNGVECATLGHRYTGEVIGHPYFGSKRVTEDLSNMRGWEIGHVELSDHNCLVKNAQTGLVCGLQQ